MDRLAELGRLDSLGGTTRNLLWKWYEDEVPGQRINNVWRRRWAPRGKRYVVETAPKRDRALHANDHRSG